LERNVETIINRRAHGLFFLENVEILRPKAAAILKLE